MATIMTQKTDGALTPAEPESAKAIASAPMVANSASQKEVRTPRSVLKRDRSLGSLFIKFVLPLGAVALLVFAVQQVVVKQKVDIPVAPPVQPARTPFTNTVAGNGMIEAQRENIAVGSPVPGLVVEVFAKEGDRVKVGDPLFRLDDRQLQAELHVRQANVDAAKAELERLESLPRPEEVPLREALVTESEANLAQQRDLLRRTTELYNKRVATEQELTQAQQGYHAAEARLAHAQADLKLLKSGAWKYQKQVAQASVEQAEAQVQWVKQELDRLVVRALDDGEVLQVNVRPGEFVGAPHHEPLLLLGDVDKLHVRVDIDEHDIPRFQPGRPAKAAVKGHPDKMFPLTFVRVEPYVIPKRSLTGSNIERVDTRVLQVIYAFEPTADKNVYVGQQVEVFIDAEGSESK